MWAMDVQINMASHRAELRERYVSYIKPPAGGFWSADLTEVEHKFGAGVVLVSDLRSSRKIEDEDNENEHELQTDNRSTLPAGFLDDEIV